MALPMDLSFADLTSADLSGMHFLEADLTGADLSKATLVGTVFERARLFGALLDQTRAEAEGAIFIDCVGPLRVEVGVSGPWTIPPQPPFAAAVVVTPAIYASASAATTNANGSAGFSAGITSTPCPPAQPPPTAMSVGPTTTGGGWWLVNGGHSGPIDGQAERRLWVEMHSSSPFHTITWAARRRSLVNTSWAKAAKARRRNGGASKASPDGKRRAPVGLSKRHRDRDTRW